MASFPGGVPFMCLCKTHNHPNGRIQSLLKLVSYIEIIFICATDGSDTCGYADGSDISEIKDELPSDFCLGVIMVTAAHHSFDDKSSSGKSFSVS